MSKHLRILLVEDSEADIELIRYQFSKQKIDVEWVNVDSATQFRNELKTNPDLVISDMEVPGFGAYAALQIFGESSQPHPPLVVISGAVGEEVAVEAMKAGAKDFVVKSNLSKLTSVAIRAIREASLERIEAEQRARAEQAIRDRERLLEIVSHDLKNPLAAMTLNLQILRSSVETETGSPIRARSLVDRLERSVSRVDRLIRDVLDQAKIEAGKFLISPQSVTLTEIFVELREELEGMADEKSVSLVFHNRLTRDELRVDPDRILQVLANLISNALKVSEPGHAIEVTAEELPDSRVQFEVKDQGQGIPESDLELVFTKFWQAPDRQKFGTGLGLSIARQIVEGHGGEIGVRSQVGQGSEFWFRLPRQVFSEYDMKRRDAKVTKIMILEDDEDLREVVHESLEASFGEVVSFPSAIPALKHLAEGHRPDLFIVDHDLPGISGGDFIQELRRRSYLADGARLVMTSAHPDLKDRARNVGVTEILQKPFNLKKLRSRIEDWQS